MARWRTILLLATAAYALAGGGVAQARTHAPVSIACKSGYYKNSSGKCVHSPSTAPAGATAKCRDGTFSYSLHASGTCSHHGGVAVWIHHP
ncbi:MAG: DUF3761 domain-containing protein [Gaiellaceae bacterium]